MNNNVRRDGCVQLVLASSSPYRRKILSSTRLDFEHCSPDIDETPAQEETPHQLAERLSIEKARAVAHLFPDSVIIGSDQAGELDGEIFGKPGNMENAISQLRRSSGKTVTLHTGIAVLNAASGTVQSDVDCFDVTYRELSDSQIRSYLEQEQPFDCCGGIKVEGPGIALLRSLRGNDPNTLIGLPLIMLLDMLENEGILLF